MSIISKYSSFEEMKKQLLKLDCFIDNECLDKYINLIIFNVENSVEAQKFIIKYTGDKKYVRSGISRCCSGQSLFYKNFLFLYEEESYKQRREKLLNNRYAKGRLQKRHQYNYIQ